MSDSQLQQRIVIKHRLIIAALLIVVSVALVYYRIYTEAAWSQYQFEKQQEQSIQAQVDSLTSANAQLMATIEENGKQLVSFSEDKIKYINLASELSITHDVRINKLTVSDIWQEGEMSCMTTTIEVEGGLENVRAFVEEYCGTNYTNRINVVSCRPSGRYVWLKRDIDDEKVLTWFDLAEDTALYNDLQNEEEALEAQANSEFGIPAATDDDVTTEYVYDVETGEFKDPVTGVTIDQETLDETPITLDKMFAPIPMKVYLVIDFLGRA